MKVAKFGGSSLADASQIKKVLEIVRADKELRCVVVSAPGKRDSKDVKITELLYSWVRSQNSRDKKAAEKAIINRYQSIADGFGLNIDFAEWFFVIKNATEENYVVSRGEYWMANIMSMILGFEFVDASFIAFAENGVLDIKRTEENARATALKKIAAKKGIVVPGFYGLLPNGDVKTFSRGGSDITGAIIALCVNASLYENWTDVSGVFMADPKVVKNPRLVDKLTYKELRELAYMGADVLHDESVFPIRARGIPINVRNTNRPQDKGTMIVPKIDPAERIQGTIIGIAGRKGFSVIMLEKALMDNEVGFLSNLCGIFSKHNINIEHIPSGIDTLSAVVESGSLESVLENVLKEIKEVCSPDIVRVENGIALICVVGSAMAKTPGVAARIFSAIAKANINIRMINQGSSEISIIIGVDEKDCEKAIQSVYNEFTS